MINIDTKKLFNIIYKISAYWLGWLGIGTFEDDQPMIVLTRDIVNSAKHVIAYLRSTMEDDV